ncbi:hypothetical protein DIZ76_012998 [Coccidioides immitis]|nr:hypothetical protein DIZ76_012998 [Coccidioides immitis]
MATRIKVEPDLYAPRFAPGKELGSGLMLTSALDVENPTEPDLQGPIHPMFQLERWPELMLDRARYDSFRPSFILATKLLKVAGPFLASVIPKLRMDSRKEYIVVKESVAESQLHRCFERLDVIAQHTEWRENSVMWPNIGRHGLIAPHGGGIEPDQPRDDEDVEVWENSTKRDISNGLPCRKMTVYLASQYGEALMKFGGMEPPSIIYLQVVFMCAVTLVHEIAHLAFSACFSNRPWRGEPLVKDEVLRELGSSLIAWLFKGWVPENISIDPNDKDDHSFKYGCCWYKQRRHPRAHPQYTTVHSMPMSYIQSILSQKKWDMFDEYDMPSYSMAVRTLLLEPSLPFPAGITARIARKAKRVQVDEDPALVPYSGIWDYHDPDWGESGRLGSNEKIPCSPKTPSLKSEVDARETNDGPRGGRSAISPPPANRKGEVSEEFSESAASSPINIWSIPSASKSPSPLQRGEMQPRSERSGQGDCVRSESANREECRDVGISYEECQTAGVQRSRFNGSTISYPRNLADVGANVTGPNSMPASLRQRRSACPSRPSFRGRGNGGHHISHDSVGNSHSQLDNEDSGITKHGMQRFPVMAPPSVHNSLRRWPAERPLRRSRRLQGLEPEMPDGLQPPKRRRVVRP